MPQSIGGMCLVGDIDVIGLDIRPGCRVRVLVVSDPNYGDPEADGSDPVPKLSDADRAFWQNVLDQSHAANTRQ